MIAPRWLLCAIGDFERAPRKWFARALAICAFRSSAVVGKTVRDASENFTNIVQGFSRVAQTIIGYSPLQCRLVGTLFSESNWRNQDADALSHAVLETEILLAGAGDTLAA